MRLTLMRHNPLFEPIRIEDLITRLLNAEICKFLIHRYHLVPTTGTIETTWAPSLHPLYTHVIEHLSFVRNDSRERIEDRFLYDERGRMVRFSFRGVLYHIEETMVSSTGILRYVIRQGKHVLTELLTVEEKDNQILVRIPVEMKVSPSLIGEKEVMPLIPGARVRISRNSMYREYFSRLVSETEISHFMTLDISPPENGEEGKNVLKVLRDGETDQEIIELDPLGKVRRKYQPTESICVDDINLHYTHYTSEGYPYRAISDSGVEYEIQLSSQLYRLKDAPFGKIVPILAEPISKSDPSGNTESMEPIQIMRLMKPSMSFEYYGSAHREVYTQDRSLCAITKENGVQYEVSIQVGKGAVTVFRDVTIHDMGRLIHSCRHHSDGRIVSYSEKDGIWHDDI